MVESRQEECLTIIALFTVLAFVFTGTRVYSRYLGRNFGWDDYLIILSTFILLGESITTWKCESQLSTWLLTASLCGHSRTSKWNWLPRPRPTKEDNQGTSHYKPMELRRPDVLPSYDVCDTCFNHPVSLAHEGQA
jgi:hypothetical protein